MIILIILSAIISMQNRLLGEVYSFDRISSLANSLDAIRHEANPSDLKSILVCLERHIAAAKAVRISEDPQKNLIAGIELYGEAIDLLEETAAYLFDRCGDSTAVFSASFWKRVLTDCLIIPNAPLIEREIASTMSAKGTILYVKCRLQDEAVIRREIRSLQGKITFPVQPVKSDVLESLVRAGHLHVLNVDLISSYANFVFIRFSFQVMSADGPRNIANFSYPVFYSIDKDEIRLLNPPF